MTCTSGRDGSKPSCDRTPHFGGSSCAICLRVHGVSASGSSWASRSCSRAWRCNCFTHGDSGCTDRLSIFTRIHSSGGIHALMIRRFDRPVVIGVSVTALVVALAGVWLKHDAPRMDDQMNSSRQRAAVSVGAVREQPVPAAPIAPASSTAVDTRDESKSTPEADRLPAEARPAPETKSARSDHVASTKAHAKRSAQLRDEIAQAHNPIVSRPPADPPPVNEPQAAETAKPDVAPSEQSVTATPAPEPLRSAPTAATSTGPKTRKQVEDELRAARSTGALPRFGNPDPAGPGGAPGNLSRSSE